MSTMEITEDQPDPRRNDLWLFLSSGRWHRVGIGWRRSAPREISSSTPSCRPRAIRPVHQLTVDLVEDHALPISLRKVATH